jgi:hypothetical protein
MDRERAILDVMGRMYEAAADPAHLPEIGTALRDGLGVESGIMFVCEQATGRMLHLLQASGIFDETARRDYAAHYHAINPWFRKALLRRPPITARGEELLDTDAFARSEFATDWCGRVGIYHVIGSVRPVAPDVVVGAGVHRTRAEGAFGVEDKLRYLLLCGQFVARCNSPGGSGRSRDRRSRASMRRGWGFTKPPQHGKRPARSGEPA